MRGGPRSAGRKRRQMGELWCPGSGNGDRRGLDLTVLRFAVRTSSRGQGRKHESHHATVGLS